MISVKTYNLRNLKVKFENRDFAIPEIQRQYVWKRKQVLQLMDSIFRHYPIGISLVWLAPFKKAIHIRPNNKTIVPPFNNKAKYAELIIDGQQRLSTLYGVLKGVETKFEVGSEINFREIFFDCDKNATKRFVFSKRYDENTKGYVRLHDLVNTPPSLLRKQLGLTKWEATEVLKCYKAFHSYSFIMLEYSSADFDDIREVFIRINSAGMKVSRADTLFAKATEVDLRDHILNTKRGLKYGYDQVSTEAMQSALALVYGAPRISGREMESVLAKLQRDKKEIQDFSRQWKKLQKGFEEAVDFLVNTLKVPSPRYLPSQNMYTMLAYFYYLKGSRATTLQIKELKKWFWNTACGERYSGASFNRNIPDDIRFFQRLAHNENAKFSVTEKLNPIDFIKADYSKKSGVSNAYFLLLRIQKPLYLKNGEEILLDHPSSISNRKDRHHIYPKALLKRNGISMKWINSVCNICYLESDENQSINASHPSTYLKEYDYLYHFRKVMKSHLIPVDKTSPVWNRQTKSSFLSFLNIRAKLLISEVDKLAGGKMFEKFENITRI